MRASDRHPTALELFEAARNEFPSLSLGTVYRNLDVLVSEGQAQVVPSESGATRYDGNVEPHHHFVCEACGEIQDVEMSLPESLQQRLRRRYRLRAERATVRFFGLCHDCRGR